MSYPRDAPSQHLQAVFIWSDGPFKVVKNRAMYEMCQEQITTSQQSPIEDYWAPLVIYKFLRTLL
jgi:hypothetical protein